MLVEYTYVWTYPGSTIDSDTTIWNAFFRSDVHDSAKVYIITRDSYWAYLHAVDVIPCNHG